MKLITSPFGSFGHALAATVRDARERGEHLIEIPNGTYDIDWRDVPTATVCVANHGHNGYKSAALVMEDMQDLTVDGGGSTFILHGCMDFAIVSRSRNITIKNLTVRCADTCNFQGRVIASEGGEVTIKLEEHAKLHLHGTHLWQKFFDNNWEPMGRTLDYMPETRELRHGTGDENFGMKFHDIPKEYDAENDLLYLHDVPVAPPVGDVIVFTMSRRAGQAFLLSHSKDVAVEDVTVGTCWGMAFIAQKCENVAIRRCTVTPDGDRCWSAGQDATHFVNCRGSVIIEDSRFENQLDDAVNLHGIYTRIDGVADNRILVRYAHFQARGIDIYAVGDRIQMMYPENQMPIGFATVAAVEVINPDTTVLTLTETEGEIAKGMIVENLSDEAEAYIRRNLIRNNRARGMLIAAKGHIEITDNHFHSGGSAIQFESDPFHWYECGGTRDVLIARNFFDDCRHGKWSRAVVDINKRREVVEGFYYHDRIEIRDNRFTQTNVPCVAADNVGNLIFENNEYADSITSVVAAHCVVNGETVE